MKDEEKEVKAALTVPELPKKGPPAKKGAAQKESSSSSEEEVIIPVQRSEAEIQKQKDANRARLEEIKKKRELDALKK